MILPIVADTTQIANFLQLRYYNDPNRELWLHHLMTTINSVFIFKANPVKLYEQRVQTFTFFFLNPVDIFELLIFQNIIRFDNLDINVCCFDMLTSLLNRKDHG